MLTRNEGRSSCCAALLGVVVGKKRTLIGDSIDVWRATTHHAAVVRTDVIHANIVAEYDEDVGLVFCRSDSRSQQDHSADDPLERLGQ
jgi:hypothetical protein